SPWLVCNSMEYQNGQPLLGRAPAGAHDPHLERISRRQVTVPKKSGRLKENWRGGFHREYQVFRIHEGEPTQELRLDDRTKERFERGFIGWAVHEGHEVVEDKARTRTEALIPRDLRRASQHLRQVEAIMNGVDPTDKELLRRIREGKGGEQAG
ncbi:hypothetical protein, partial [Roseovarius dicentrarchi]|uniref:hypothetical protein n=1 Tax=Roseovarius dicentrarchi TaxID=2250573 RepID=UPI00193976ED